MPKTSKSGNSDLTFKGKNTFKSNFFLVLLNNNALMYFYETPVPLFRSFRELSRRLGKKWRIFEKNSRIFVKKLKDLDKKLKEFCPKLSNLATLSWWWLLKIGQKKAWVCSIQKQACLEISAQNPRNWIIIQLHQ